MSAEIPELSVVVPIFNEAAGLVVFHQAISAVLKKMKLTPEIIYVNDGSQDMSTKILAEIAKTDFAVKVITLSRNFGKEYALTAGIEQSRGSAVIMIDADGQHPVELIPDFLETWKAGADVVIGVKSEASSIYSNLFYKIFNRIAHEHLIPHSTDYRLLDRKVVTEFLALHEDNRITRGLIDWLGFKRETITFVPKPRVHGEPAYSSKQLRKLAVNSFISLSTVPLFIFGYIGVFITLASGILGLGLLIEQVILRDPLHWHFTGTALLGTLILFLIGFVLMSQGMIALYISHIHTQSKRRPLYIIDHSRSIGLKK